MSLFDGKPIKRVDFSSKPQPADTHNFAAWDHCCTVCGATREEVDDNLKPKTCSGPVTVPDRAEQERIWRATKASAEGSNIRAADPSEWHR